MTFFIRTKNKKNIVEVEYFFDGGFLQINAIVNILFYSDYLLFLCESDAELAYEFITDIKSLNELRNWIFTGRTNQKDEYLEVLKELRNKFTTVANKYDLIFAED